VPEKIFYLPAGMMWLALSLRHHSLTLPSAANPGLEVGGLWGESKRQGETLFGTEARAWMAPGMSCVRGATEAAQEAASAIAAAAAAGLPLPLVVKPDRGYQGWGVRRIDEASDLAAFLKDYPAGEVYCLQLLVPWDAEAGVFYVRQPGTERGVILSLAFTYFPHVVGDGRSTVGELILACGLARRHRVRHLQRFGMALERVPANGETVRLGFCGSARMGAAYQDGRALITPALTRRFEAIARDIPGFHFGRFDVRFRTLDTFLAGREFRIIEMNGAGAEMLHIWDPRATLGAAYRALWQQYSLAFEIGQANRSRGCRPAGWLPMLAHWRNQERLRRLYPAAN
jgi:hypothetical protein